MTDKILCPHSLTINGFLCSQLSSPFDDLALDFIEALSMSLLSLDAESSELKALGFWFRKQKVRELQNTFSELSSQHHIRPKGTIFQIAAGNTAVQFMYPSLIALLLGNRVLVRLSSKTSVLRDSLIQILNTLFEQEKYQGIAQRFVLLLSDYDSDLIKSLSIKCDLRMIWGGDKTVQHVRQMTLNPKAKDLSFADRASIALMNAEAVCRCDDLSSVSSALLKDVLSFAQQACSSPKLIAWIGNEQDISMAKQKLLTCLNVQTPENESLSSSIEREISAQLIASMYSVTIQHHQALSYLDLNSTRVLLEEGLFSHHSGYGVLLNANFEDIEAFKHALNMHCQTLAYYGFQREELLETLGSKYLDFFDRIEPLGSSLEFHYIWDAYNLLHEFCRCIRR